MQYLCLCNIKKYVEKDKTVPFSLLHKASNIRLCGHKYMHLD